jgi:hypothetical protein
MDFYFTLMRDDGQEVEIAKNGKTTKVTKDNRKQYGMKVAKYYLYS